MDPRDNTPHPSLYNLPAPPEGKWSNDLAIPAIGTRVAITFNGLGFGSVVSYFCECGYAGVAVLLEVNPDWRRNQGQGDGKPALVFGSEIRLADPLPELPPREPMGWGLVQAIPPAAEVAWGARAIYTGGYVDLLSNRMARRGDGPRWDTFAERLDTKAIPAIRKLAQALYGRGGWGELELPTILYEDDLITVVGATQRSGGYLNMAAWYNQKALPAGGDHRAWKSPTTLLPKPDMPRKKAAKRLPADHRRW